MSGAYYNEIDPYAAQWLRNLIAAGHIAAGDVDERSIEDVRPDDLRGYTQCHFFAGIGGWPLAFRLAGWPDDRPVWSGSCPCQPFSAAGKGLGLDDPRHVWPAWKHLIGERGPSKVFGEQVASKDAEYWLDIVSTDMESMGFAFGAIAFPSASVDAPHIRDRTYFVAHAGSQRRDRQRLRLQPRQPRQDNAETGWRSKTSFVADTAGRQRNGIAVVRGAERDGADANGGHAGAERIQRSGQHGFLEEDGRIERIESAGPTNGFWRSADWLLCRDEKWRPVEPGTFPLVDGLPAGMGKLSAGLRRLVEMAGLDAASLKRAKAYRVGSLRGCGNAINPHQAAEFIRAAGEALTELA